MTSIREIRIGNLFTAGVMTDYTEVFSMHFDISCGEYLINKSIPISHLHPISLTPEILEKCGFEKELIFDIIRFTHKLNNFIVIDNADEVFVMKLMSSNNGMTSNNMIIESLHQLQNLYYALTGTELEIKL